MGKQLSVLLVSCRQENRKTMLQVLSELPVNSFSVSSVAQAKEFLFAHQLELVFCEEWLHDGSYREVLAEVHSKSPCTRFVLMLCTGEWEEYLEALRLGVVEVLRAPLQAIDIDLALIHALRDTSKGAELTVQMTTNGEGGSTFPENDHVSVR